MLTSTDLLFCPCISETAAWEAREEAANPTAPRAAEPVTPSSDEETGVDDTSAAPVAEMEKVQLSERDRLLGRV